MTRAALVMALIAACAAAPLQAAPPLAERLPAEAIIYAGWAGRNLTFDGSLLGQLLSQPSVAEALNSFGGALVMATDEPARQQAVEHRLAMLAIAWQHRAAVCVLAGGQGSPPRAPAAPELALLVDLGKDQPAFAEHLEALVQLAGSSLAISEATTGAVTYRTFRASPPGALLAYGYMGDLLFFTVGTEMPARLIAVSAAAAPNLASAAPFTAAYAEVAGENEQIVLYAYVPGVAGMLRRLAAPGADPSAPGDIDRALEALGLTQLAHVAATTRVVDRGMYTRVRLATPPPHRGLPLLLGGLPLTGEDLAVAPADTEAMLTCRLSAAVAWAEIQRMLAAVHGRWAAQLGRALGQLAAPAGLSLEEDVLAALGDQWTLVSASSLGGLGTGTALVVDLKAPDRAAEALAALEAALAGPPAGPEGKTLLHRRADPSLQKLQARGARDEGSLEASRTTVTYLQMPGQQDLAPAWAIHGGRLIVAGWPQVVQALIERDLAAALGGEAGFQGVFKYITGRPSLLWYFNTPRVLDRAYSLPLRRWTESANRAHREGLFLRPHWLPSLDVLNRHVGPSILAVSVDDRGILVEDYGWLPMVPSALAAALAARWMGPNAARAMPAGHWLLDLVQRAVAWSPGGRGSEE